MSFVVDTSATIAYIYPDETISAIIAIFDQVKENGAWVPAHWRLEIANVLEIGIRRGRYTASLRDTSLADIQLFPIKIDPETNDHAWETIIDLAHHHRLTVYDAAYLELALRRGLPLISLDKDLRKAAADENLIVLGK